jgi:hypothetical protein
MVGTGTFIAPGADPPAIVGTVDGGADTTVAGIGDSGAGGAGVGEGAEAAAGCAVAFAAVVPGVGFAPVAALTLASALTRALALADCGGHFAAGATGFFAFCASVVDAFAPGDCAAAAAAQLPSNQTIRTAGRIVTMQ